MRKEELQSLCFLCFPTSKLEKVANSGSKLDSKWKYLTGEWFYEAKSRRHMDKIHGSEIILASMKQNKAALGVLVDTVDTGLLVNVVHSVNDCHPSPAADGSLKTEGSKTPTSQGSDVVAPAKPARCLEILEQQAIKYTQFLFILLLGCLYLSLPLLCCKRVHQGGFKTWQ